MPLTSSGVNDGVVVGNVIRGEGWGGDWVKGDPGFTILLKDVVDN